ncbi:hypothetical protein K450DRAFT_253299 [Umbelopsis ramanniana AG]|uniref:Uncharacterized protein n=1 Tax=Umbelopsis ramanniana AG TaxID=1314678 RepID=A0AAD5E5T8_UMBRA|nr:uncharacterized protein K450DRAFT_253299 [Umbelopsis ramanniana AG]KAI8577189.1 hypothetical protein K450DRAFT_253299 [Umbelopsis ramanniana AG]
MVCSLRSRHAVIAGFMLLSHLYSFFLFFVHCQNAVNFSFSVQVIIPSKVSLSQKKKKFNKNASKYISKRYRTTMYFIVQPEHLV